MNRTARDIVNNFERDRDEWELQKRRKAVNAAMPTLVDRKPVRPVVERNSPERHYFRTFGRPERPNADAIE